MSEIAPLLRSKITAVWILLVAATLLSWWLGTDHGFGADDHQAAAVIILLVAFFKARLVGSYFMELRDAPPALRWSFEAYIGAVCALLVGAYLIL